MKLRHKPPTGKKKITANRRPNVLKIDPTRTGLLRQRFVASIRRQFKRLRGQIMKLLVVEDAFGLVERQPLVNVESFFATCDRDGRGYCLPGDGGSTSYAGVDEGDYETWAHESDLINQIMRGEDVVGRLGSMGHETTEEDAKTFKRIAEKIQRAAENNGVSQVILFRGVSFDSEKEFKEAFKHNKVIEAPHLTSTTTDLDAAEAYAHSNQDPGESGRFPVIVEYHNGNGHQGIQTAPLGVPSNEVILPKGAKYRVSRKHVDEKGVTHVVLYSKEKPRGTIVDASSPTGNSNPEGCNQHTGPGCGGGGRVDQGVREPNPIPRVDRSTELAVEDAFYKDVGKEKLQDYLAYAATEEVVPISSLRSPQAVNDPEAVDYFKNHPDLIESGKLPLVIQYGGLMFLRDGNSRVTAAMRLGKESVKARVVYLQPTSNVFCPTGEGGGVDPSCSPGGAAGGSDKGADSPGMVKAVGSFFARVGSAVGGKIKALVQKQYRMLESRYGSKWAKAGMAAFVAGLPVPIPGSTLITMAPVVALAELSKQLGFIKNEEGEDDAPPKPLEEIGQELFTALTLMLGEDPEILKALRQPTANDRYRFSSDPEKVKVFQAWLKDQVQTLLIGRSEEALWAAYVQEGFRKGAGRAFDDTNKFKWGAGEGKFYEGSKQQFMRSAFGRPEAVDKVKLLASRSFDELQGMTGDMALRMSRHLTDGLVQGQNPREIARTLDDDLGIGERRAEVIARTEIIRAHAEGQLEAMSQLGVQEVGVAVEWSTAGDDRVCELCEPLEGIVMKIEEARGMLPRHPQCRCAWLPANVGEDDEDQKDTKGQIGGAIRESLKREGQRDDEDSDPWGPARAVSRSRPQSIFNQQLPPELLEFSQSLRSLE